MRNLKEKRFYITVNPFTQQYNITVLIDSCTYEVEKFYNQADEWNEFQIGNEKYDVHVLYDDVFWIYISRVEYGYDLGCGQIQDVEVKIILFDGDAGIKLEYPKYQTILNN